MNDTDPKINAIYQRMLMAKSPAERVKMASSMHATAKKIVLASLKKQYPRASDSELRAHLFLRFYGDDYDPDQRQVIFERLLKR